MQNAVGYSIGSSQPPAKRQSDLSRIDSKQQIKMKNQSGPLINLPERDREIMARLLRMSPEPQKDAPKPMTSKGVAQRRRREKERSVQSPHN
jgi:hypothetical protein